MRLRRIECQCLRRHQNSLFLFVNVVILYQLSIATWDSEFVVTMSTQEYVHFKVEVDVNHPCVPIEEDTLNILGAL
jgi:hypothetical protein